MGDIHSDLYDDVTSGGSDTYELEYKGSTYRFEVSALARARKNDLLDALPEGYFDPVIDPDELEDVEVSELGMDDLRELLEERGSSIGEFSKARTLDREATERAIDAMSEAYSHPELTSSEIENLLRSSQFPDAAFEEMLVALIDVSTPGDDVREFRPSE